jgi:hypothetical protein
MLQRREEALTELAAEIADGGYTAFPLVVTGGDVDQAISTVVQAAGIGPLRANTVIANWSAQGTAMPAPIGTRRFGRNLRTAFRLDCNLLVLDAGDEEWQRLERVAPRERTIDIWWRANKTGELMLLLGHLVTRSEAWEGATLRVLADDRQGDSPVKLETELRAALEGYRIEAEVVVASVEPEEIARRSGNASLVFLPFSIHGDQLRGPTGEVGSLLPVLPIVAMVLAAQDVDLGADPDHEDEEEEPESSDSVRMRSRESEP